MPHPMIGRHLSVMLSGPMGVDVKIGRSSSRGLFDDDTAIIEDGTGEGVERRTRSVLIRAGTLAGLAVGATMRVDGVDYEVRRLLTVDDGQLTRVLVARVD